MSTKWPTSVATDADLYVAVNSLQTTLSTSLGTGDTSVVLASATGFPVAGGVTIGNEVIFYTGVSGATLTGCTRGADGTTAAAHSVGVPVGAAIIAFHHNGLMAEIEAIESYLDTVLGKGTSVTATEFGYVHGVTSAIQTQFGLKAPLAGPTFTGTVTIPTPFTIGAVSMTATGTELNYVVGVTSAIQTQLNLKAPLAGPTFSGTITTPLTGNRAMATGGSGVLAVSATTDTELGYVSGVVEALQGQIDAIQRNRIINSGFDFWQRGTSTTVANTVSTYQADRFYAKNSLGTNGVITYSQVAAAVTGSAFGASIKITTAPTAAQTNGCEFYTVLENLDTLRLLNQTVSVGAQVKALGNVTQVGISVMYKTTEAKVDTVLGSETLVAVNSSTFTLVSRLAQAISTTPTVSGVVGIRIRITAVSSGNTYDLNNGFVVEQVQMNIGSTLRPWMRCAESAAAEMTMCHRYYAQLPSFEYFFYDGLGSSGYLFPFKFPQTMRAAPTVTVAAGTTTHVSGVSTKGINADGFSLVISTNASAGGSIIGNASTPDASWKADAEI